MALLDILRKPGALAVVMMLASCGSELSDHHLAHVPTALVADNKLADGGVSSFYDWAGTLPAQHGAVLRVEPLPSRLLLSGAESGFRILYSSVGNAGPVATSGQVFLPKGDAPPGGWPVIAWEHGTTGIADVCAPSWRGYSSRDRAYLNRFLAEGFAIVATDYQGLGTAGPHSYLLYQPEAQSVLDGLRAALTHFHDELANRIIYVGQSQGSGAAIGSAWLAPRYAPELHGLGVVATGLVVEFAPSSHPRHKPLPQVYGDASQMDAAFAMLRVQGTDQSLHPDLEARDYMTPEGIGLSHVARTACLHDMFDYAADHHLDGSKLFKSNLPKFEAGHDPAFQIPTASINIPVFAGTGLADGEAGTAGQYNAVASMCDAGTQVVWKRYEGLTHNGTVNASLVDSIPFIRQIMAKKAIRMSCRDVTPPGPIQEPRKNIPWNN